MGFHEFGPRVDGFTVHIFDIWMRGQSLTAMLKFNILALDGFRGVSWPLCMISHDFQLVCIDMALELVF